jgi:hypothetical protein
MIFSVSVRTVGSPGITGVNRAFQDIGIVDPDEQIDAERVAEGKIVLSWVKSL